MYGQVAPGEEILHQQLYNIVARIAQDVFFLALEAPLLVFIQGGQSPHNPWRGTSAHRCIRSERCEDA